MSSKQNRPEVSIELIKEVVKRYKKQGFEAMTHHDLAVALTTIGFSEVCKEFGANWNDKHNRQALAVLEGSDYNLSWYGKPNSLRFNTLIALCRRGDIEKLKDEIRSVGGQSKNDMISTVDNFKRTCLHIAVQENFDIMAEYLINEGFSVNSRDRELKTPLHYCRSELIAQVLLNHKAKVLVKDNKACTPVHYAASGSDYNTLQLMLKHANMVNEPDSTGKTPIFYAVYNSSEEQINIIRILLENGGNVNSKDIDGKTALHYAASMGKTRCLPILLQKGASIDILDRHNKTALDLALNQKVKKIITVYCNNKGLIFDDEQKRKREEFQQIGTKNLKSSKLHSSTAQRGGKASETNSQIYTQNINQVSTWIREKFFVLMKKLQESGVKAYWHLKRPYVYTGSWAEDVDSLEDLYEIFLNANGPEAAMRTFNLLCPYEKALPSVTSRTEQAFQSFFGENWFSNDPIEKVRNMHSTSKIRGQLQLKVKQNQDLKLELNGYKSQIENLESRIISYSDELNQYKKVEDELRRERSKNTQQYTQLLKLMNQNEELKTEIEGLVGGQERTKMLSAMIEDLKSKNNDLKAQIQKLKDVEAAARRKCGSIFLKTLSMAQNSEFTVPDSENMYDDDAIISLYNLLKGNPPNLEQRFRNSDRRGVKKLNIDEFTHMLEEISMLPQDVMSMHRITGFAFGRKFLSLEEFKTILENRHKNRPMWQKKLIRKMKTIIVENGLSLLQFFNVLDKDGNGTIEATELRRGLQNHNIFMNQNDWSNLFNLLDSDNSGEIDLEELKTLMQQERTGKLDEARSLTESAQHQQKIVGQEKQQLKEEQQKLEQDEAQKEGQIREEQNKSEPEQFVTPYEEEDSEEAQGIKRLDGVLKIQLRYLKLKEDVTKFWVKFFISEDIDSDDAIKMVDLAEGSKLNIATELKFIKYKYMDSGQLDLNASVWKSRDMDEESYLGEVFVQLAKVFETPNQWAITEKFKLNSERFAKNVNGRLYLQIRWTPDEDE